MSLRLMTLNINGLNCKKKQLLFFDFIKQNNVHFINLQEHNLKDKNNLLDIYYDNYHVFLNESIYLKGGTAVLIDKRVTDNIILAEKSSDSRITSVKLAIAEKRLHILNIYAPSGSKYHKEREKCLNIKFYIFLETI